MPDSGGLHALEISKRPRNSWMQTIRAIVFAVVFNIGCIMVNGFQFTVLLPLGLLPFATTKKLYEEGIRYSKGAFGTLIGMYNFLFCERSWPSTSAVTVLVSQLFAPTTLLVTFQREGLGGFTEEEIDRVAERDASGRVVSLHLPEKAVLIANHQVSLG